MKLAQFVSIVMLVVAVFVAGDFIRGTLAEVDTGFIAEKQEEAEQSSESLGQKLDSLRNR